MLPVIGSDWYNYGGGFFSPDTLYLLKLSNFSIVSVYHYF